MMTTEQDYGLSPAQYHEGLDKLWSALENVTYNGERDVFTMCADRIKELEELSDKLLTAESDNETLRLSIRNNSIANAELQSELYDDTHAKLNPEKVDHTFTHRFKNAMPEGYK